MTTPEQIEIVDVGGNHRSNGDAKLALRVKGVDVDLQSFRLDKAGARNAIAKAWASLADCPLHVMQAKLRGVALARATEDQRRQPPEPQSAQPAEPGPLPAWASEQTATLLEAVSVFIKRFLIVGEDELTALVLWVLHSWTVAGADTTPYLSITSVTKRCGKTLLLELLSLLTWKPWLTGRVSGAVLMRKTQVGCTLLLDECDSTLAGDKEYLAHLTGLLNSGYRRGGCASVCSKHPGGGFVLEDFSTFGAKAFAGIGRHLPDTVVDRAIPIVLKRKTKQEKVDRFRWRTAKTLAIPIRESLEGWTVACVAGLVDAAPVVPKGLNDRAADVWECLLAIADVAGEAWGQKARTAANGLSAGDAAEDSEDAVRLAGALRIVFDADARATRLPTGTLLAELGKLGGEGEFAGFTPRGLAIVLGRLSIRSGHWRAKTEGGGSGTIRGYLRASFEDVWLRYPPPQPGTNGTPLSDKDLQQKRTGTDGVVVPDENAHNPLSDNVVPLVPDEKGGMSTQIQNEGAERPPPTPVAGGDGLDPPGDEPREVVEL